MPYPNKNESNSLGQINMKKKQIEWNRKVFCIQIEMTQWSK